VKIVKIKQIQPTGAHALRAATEPYNRMQQAYQL